MMKILIVLNFLTFVSISYACFCGLIKSQKRIVGGEKVEPNLYPWLALIRLESYGQKFTCGGALINDQYLITAAQCFHGLKNLNVVVEMYGNLTFEIEKFIIHPNYELLPILTNDIALVKLKVKVKFSPSISPICLLEDRTQIFKKFTVAGWDDFLVEDKNIEHLMHVDVPHVSLDTCNRQWAGRLNPLAHVCAGELGKDACKGDVGVPLMLDKDGLMFSAGIVSFGRGCGTDVPSVYTKVVTYVPWIKENTKDAKYCNVIKH